MTAYQLENGFFRYRGEFYLEASGANVIGNRLGVCWYVVRMFADDTEARRVAVFNVAP